MKMTTQTTENFDKVYDYIRENNVWDDIYMDIADDHEENTYIIMDSWDDIAKFAKIVKQVLGIDEDEEIYIDEVLGVEIVFSDEYNTCSDCHSVIRTSPDSYHWQPDFMMGDGFIACSKCFNENEDRKSTRLNSSHVKSSYAVFCLKKEPHKTTGHS